MFAIRTEESSRSGRDASVTLESFALLCKIFKCFLFFFACETTSFDGEAKRSRPVCESREFEAATKHVSQRASGWAVGGRRELWGVAVQISSVFWQRFLQKNSFLTREMRCESAHRKGNQLKSSRDEKEKKHTCSACLQVYQRESLTRRSDWIFHSPPQRLFWGICCLEGAAQRTRVTRHVYTGQPCVADINRWEWEMQMFPRACRIFYVSRWLCHILFLARGRDVSALSAWERRLTYWCYSPPTVPSLSLSLSERRMHHRSVLIKRAIRNSRLVLRGLVSCLADGGSTRSSVKAWGARVSP